MSFAGNDRLGIPAMKVVGGAMGISGKTGGTAFPVNIGVAATWNPELAEKEGTVIAQQARAMGRGQILGPLAEVSESPLSGRVFESYGENPWLASKMVSSYISGVQGEGEIATAVFRQPMGRGRDAREHQMHPLEAAVSEAGVWSVMANDASPIGRFLRGELGFRGFVVAPETEPGDAAYDATDDAVRGVLRAMAASGVFDSEGKTTDKSETKEQRGLAREIAERSIVLLKNDHELLPLDRNRTHSIAVFGPNAAVNRMAAGSYTAAGRYSETPLDALRNLFGRGVTAASSPAEAAHADVAIVFAGSGAATEKETMDRASLQLPAGQDRLIADVARANPRTIVVLIAGYPVAMENWIERVPAVLDAWFPGEEGGNAIAEALSGLVNPSGRLPIAFPQFPFGFGLSYTQFEYSGLFVMPDAVSPGQFAEVSLNVRNAGSRAGRETVQLYLHTTRSADRITRADQELRDFQQVDLEPGESKRVHFTLPESATQYFDEARGQWVQDEAEFEVRAGSSSRDVRARGRFTTE